MTQHADTIFRRFLAMPRALQIAVAGGIVFIVALSWLEVAEIRDDLDTQADRIVKQVQTVRDAASLTGQMRQLRNEITAIGDVELPGEPEESTESLNTLINGLITQFRLGGTAKIGISPEGRLSKKILPQMGRLEAIKFDFNFEATPEDTAAIIAALESSPVIESVRKCRIVKSTSRRVKVSLLLEAWVKSTGGARIPGRSSA